jgi:hypothetical protein
MRSAPGWQRQDADLFFILVLWSAARFDHLAQRSKMRCMSGERKTLTATVAARGVARRGGCLAFRGLSAYSLALLIAGRSGDETFYDRFAGAPAWGLVAGNLVSRSLTADVHHR